MASGHVVTVKRSSPLLVTVIHAVLHHISLQWLQCPYVLADFFSVHLCFVVLRSMPRTTTRSSIMTSYLISFHDMPFDPVGTSKNIFISYVPCHASAYTPLHLSDCHSSRRLPFMPPMPQYTFPQCPKPPNLLTSHAHPITGSFPPRLSRLASPGLCLTSRVSLVRSGAQGRRRRCTHRLPAPHASLHARHAG